jgi:hypothetical protein
MSPQDRNIVPHIGAECLDQAGTSPEMAALKVYGCVDPAAAKAGRREGDSRVVFATHPSSSIRSSEAADPQKQGANITLESLKMASTLLAIPPAGVTPDQWFPGIAPQLLALLDGKEGPDLVKVSAYVMGYGVLGRKQFGAPGMSLPPCAGMPPLIDIRRYCRVERIRRAHARSNQPIALFADPR